MEADVLEIALVRMRAGLRKDDVILAPGDESGRLLLAEVFLPLRVLGRIGPVIVEQLQHQLLVAGSVQQSVLKYPTIRANFLGVLDAMRVVPFQRLTRDSRIANLVEVLLRRVCP